MPQSLKGISEFRRGPVFCPQMVRPVVEQFTEMEDFDDDRSQYLGSFRRTKEKHINESHWRLLYI